MKTQKNISKKYLKITVKLFILEKILLVNLLRKSNTEEQKLTNALCNLQKYFNKKNN